MTVQIKMITARIFGGVRSYEQIVLLPWFGFAIFFLSCIYKYFPSAILSHPQYMAFSLNASDDT